MEPKNSTFFFVGRISDHFARYQVQQEPLLNGFRLEVFLDGIAIWGSSDDSFLTLYPKIEEMLQTIIAAFAFKSDTPLSFTLVNWIETQKIVSTDNMIGWLLPPLSTTKPSSRRSRINTPWKKSAWFYRNFMKQGNINHRLALKDYYQARIDQSDDAFFYAYRAIEDICRAATGEDEIEKSTWRKMHRLLGTSKTLR